MREGLDGPKKYKALSFDEFMKDSNNFAVHFAGKPGEHMIGDVYRESTAYRKCMVENPDFAALAKELYGYNFSTFAIDEETAAIMPRKVDAEMNQKLYKAYLMLRPYVETDWELFR